MHTVMYMHVCSCTWELIDRHKSKQGKTNLNTSFSIENEKRASQVGLEPTTYCLLVRLCTCVYVYVHRCTAWKHPIVKEGEEER